MVQQKYRVFPQRELLKDYWLFWPSTGLSCDVWHHTKTNIHWEYFFFLENWIRSYTCNRLNKNWSVWWMTLFALESEKILNTNCLIYIHFKILNVFFIFSFQILKDYLKIDNQYNSSNTENNNQHSMTFYCFQWFVWLFYVNYN